MGDAGITVKNADLLESLVFHYTSEAGKLSPGSTKEMHISTVNQVHLTYSPHYNG